MKSIKQAQTVPKLMGGDTPEISIFGHLLMRFTFTCFFASSSPTPKQCSGKKSNTKLNALSLCYLWFILVLPISIQTVVIYPFNFNIKVITAEFTGILTELNTRHYYLRWRHYFNQMN